MHHPFIHIGLARTSFLSHLELPVLYISRLHFEKDESLSLWSSMFQVSHYLGSERIFLENIDWLCYLCVFLVLNIKYDLLTPPSQTLHPHIHQHFQGIVPLFLSELSFLCCDKQRYVGWSGFAAFSCKLISSCADFNCRSEIEECASWNHTSSTARVYNICHPPDSALFTVPPPIREIN